MTNNALFYFESINMHGLSVNVCAHLLSGPPSTLLITSLSPNRIFLFCSRLKANCGLSDFLR